MMNQDLLEIEHLIDRGETAVALPMLEQAVLREPGHAAARLLLARAFEVEGRFDDAVSAWRLVRALVPDSPTAATGLKRALRLRMLWAADPGSWSVLAPDPGEAFGVDAPPHDDAVEEADAMSPADVATALAPEAASGGDEPGWDDVLEEVDRMPGPEDAAIPEAEAAPRAEPDRAVATWDAETQNLDELIRDLEAARIVPDPTIPPADAAELDMDVDDVVSETLARIYENQRHFDEAARVWERLAVQQPDRADEFRRKAEDARARTGS